MVLGQFRLLGEKGNGRVDPASVKQKSTFQTLFPAMEILDDIPWKEYYRHGLAS
jgi:hypothetical protein